MCFDIIESYERENWEKIFNLSYSHLAPNVIDTVITRTPQMKKKRQVKDVLFCDWRTKSMFITNKLSKVEILQKI